MLVQSNEEQETEAQLQQKIETVNKQIDDIKRQMDMAKKSADREIRKLRREIDKSRNTLKNSQGNFNAKETEVNQLRAKLDEVQRELLILEAKCNNPELRNVISTVLKRFEKFVDPQVALAFGETMEKMESLLRVADGHSSMRLDETSGSFALFGTLMSYSLFFVPLSCCFYGVFRIGTKLRLRHYVLIGNLFCFSFYLSTLFLHLMMRESPFETFRINNQSSVLLLAIFICFVFAVTCVITMFALLRSDDMKEALFYGVMFPVNVAMSLSLRNRLFYPILHHEPIELGVEFLIAAFLLYASEILIQYYIQRKLYSNIISLPVSRNMEERECYHNGNEATWFKKVLAPKAD